MLTYGNLKSHIVLALGGQPSIVSGMTRDQRIAEIVNQAGQYLFTKPWRFRERTSRPLSVTAQQNFVVLPNDVDEIIALISKAGLGWRIELTSPEQMEILRNMSEPTIMDGVYYATLSRPWAIDNTTTELTQGSGLPDLRLELYPTPQTTTSDSVTVRYRANWQTVQSSTSETFIVPVPTYAESLLIAYARSFAMAYEDEGLTARLLEIDNGPIYGNAAVKDGIQQRDVGRLLPNRVSPFRRELDQNVGNSGGPVLTPVTATANIRWRGTWDANDTYVDGDVVRIGSKTFVCVMDNTNSVPPSSSWELMAQDGADGIDGLDGNGLTANGVKLIGRGVSGFGPVSEITVTSPLKLSGTSLTLLGAGTDAVVPETRSITAGTGLTGGGDLSANRSVSVDFATSGTSSSTKAVRADDSRLSDARTPTAHTHDGADITSGTIDTSLLLVGSTVGTVCSGNDSRLSDARTPTSHTHGNITNAGAIGSTASLPIITTTSGVLTTGSFSTTSGTFCEGSDSRLSNLRRPVDADYGDITVSGSGTVMTINGGIHQYPKVAPFASFDGYAPAVNGTAAASLTTVINRLYLLPWVAPSDFTISTLKTRSVTAVTSATVYMAIYASGTDGYPTGTPLASAGPLTASGANTDITTSVSVSVTENKQYWFAIGSPSSTPPSIRSLGPVALPPLAFSITNGTSYYCIYRTWAQSFASSSAADFTANPVASSDLAASTTVASCPFLVVLK